MAKRVLLVPLLLAVAIAAGGCGSDNGGGKSSTQKLMVAQANADVEEFCSVAGVRKGDVYDRAYFALLDATDTLIDAYKSDPSLKVNLDPRRQDEPLDKIMKDAVTSLRDCGPDGKQQAGRLQQTIAAKQ
jgi:hypothetical protein